MTNDKKTIKRDPLALAARRFSTSDMAIVNEFLTMAGEAGISPEQLYNHVQEDPRGPYAGR